MTPMEPKRPMAGAKRCWPDGLGEPSTTGSQNGKRYAFFSERQRLLVEQDGKLTTYDSGDHQMSGVTQHEDTDGSLAFTSQNGSMKLDELKQVLRCLRRKTARSARTNAIASDSGGAAQRAGCRARPVRPRVLSRRLLHSRRAAASFGQSVTW
jgi:hypothetical protein